jgi:hypothetical protein
MPKFFTLEVLETSPKRGDRDSARVFMSPFRLISTWNHSLRPIGYYPLDPLRTTVGSMCITLQRSPEHIRTHPSIIWIVILCFLHHIPYCPIALGHISGYPYLRYTQTHPCAPLPVENPLSKTQPSYFADFTTLRASLVIAITY